MDKLSSTFSEKARPILDLADDLRKIGVQKTIPIPQIAVMGDQSSGKSSVLESISGIEFPRGAGLCTRCPTQVTMSQGPIWSATVLVSTGSEVEHIRELSEGEKDKIPILIDKLTTKYAGDKASGNFSQKDMYIEIKLTSPDLPDLTIIDLPGIVRTATSGQSKDVKSIVDDMLDRYLQQERTVILAVIPANVDIATVDILERASAVDPDGIRTIGVLTKPDLVDAGAEGQVLEVLANRAKPLLHGYFMVKNRSQKDLDDEKSNADAIADESRWLAKSPYGNSLSASHSRLGVDALTRALTSLLVERIMDVLPDLASEVSSILQSITQELESLGQPPPNSTSACGSMILDIIRAYCSNMLTSATEGTPIAEGTPAQTESILQKENKSRKVFAEKIRVTKPYFSGKTTLNIREMTSNTYNNVIPLQQGDTVTVPWSARHTTGLEEEYIGDGDIKYMAKVINTATTDREAVFRCMEERRGRELPGFLSFPVFCNLMSQYVDRWEEPSQWLHQELIEGFENSSVRFVSVISKEWPHLSEFLSREVEQHLEAVQTSTSTSLENLLELEKHPTTENPVLWEAINEIRDERLAEKLKSMSAECSGRIDVLVNLISQLFKSQVGTSTNESYAAQNMLDMLSAYWDLAAKRYTDAVIMTLSNAYSSSKHIRMLEKRLIRVFMVDMNQERMYNLFYENPTRAVRRMELLEHAKVMRSAQERLRKGIC